MTKKISAFALMACLATSFAFAADSNKCASSADSAKTVATQTAATDSTQQDSAVKDNKKDKHNAKPAPSTQDREFDKVLQGIYG